MMMMMMRCCSIGLGYRKLSSHYTGASVVNNYVRHRNTRTEMYAGRVACCSLMSLVEYAPRDLLKLEKKTPRAL